MKIELQRIKVADVIKGYINNDDENGVKGYDGRLNIRPPYQREFVYKDKQRDAVIDTIRKDFPLNVMYWCKNEDGSFEVLDGQQRTISIGDYVTNKFSINNFFFHNLTQTDKDIILNYELFIYVCEGNDKEKLDWFKIINIAGEKLYDQELRNAVYTGEWLSDAKRYFSKSSCPAYAIGEKYLNGSCIRQDYLETAIKWISDDKIEQYMADHQHNHTATELWNYFQAVISWIQALFPNYRREMKGIDWGFYYNQFAKNDYNPKDLEEQIVRLITDEDVTNKKGIYEYLLDGKERHLNIRAFSDNIKREAYERQKGICVKCNQYFDFSNMAGDHIIPWCKGGKTIAENCQMLCRECNGRKSGK